MKAEERKRALQLTAYMHNAGPSSHIARPGKYSISFYLPEGSILLQQSNAHIAKQAGLPNRGH